MGSLKGGGNKTQTTTENTSTVYPQWTQDANQLLQNIGLGVNAPFLQAPGYALAGFTPDQTKAFDLARQQAQSAFTGTPTGLPTNATMTAAQIATPGASGVAASPNAAQASMPVNVSAAQLGGNDFREFLNPYINAVVDNASNKARKEFRQTEAEIGARYAAAGAFGGGREVLARGKARDDFDENLQATTAQLLAQGFDTATASALANTQLRQQAAQSNADRSQQAELTNAGYRQQTLQSDADRRQQALQADADRRQQVAVQNAGYEQDARSTNLAYGLNAAQIADSFRDTNLARQNSALALLLSGGNQQQQMAQNALDIPYAALQRYASLVPQVYNTNGTQTSTQPDNRPGFLQQLLGVGLTVAGLPAGAGGSVGGNFLGKVLG